MGQFIEIHNVNEEPVAIVKTGEARIIEGYQKFVHAINITAIEFSISEIETHLSTKSISYPDLNELLDHKINDMKDRLQQLKPKTRQRRWDALGRAWKWMSGSPDADDLQLITKGINAVVDNNNKQIPINDEMFESLKNLTDVTNKLIKEESKSSRLDSEKTQILNLILNLDILNNQISAIQESITFAKVGIVNYKILSTDEISQIDESLSKQGVHTELLEEALNLAKITIGTNNEILLYVINIPAFYPESYDELQIEAIFNHSQRIQLKGNSYIRGPTELLLQKTRCERFGNWSLCHRSDLEDVSEDRCISKIIKGIESRCTYEHVSTHPLTVQMSPTTVLLNDVKTTLHNTCGITDRNLTGSFIIVYRNCSITVDKYTYTNSIIRTINQRIFIPSTSLIVMQEEVEHKIDIHSIHELQRQHLKQLEHLKSETTVHGWSLIGGFSLSSTTIILIIIFILIRFRSKGTVVQIDQQKKLADTIETSAIQYYTPASSDPAKLAV